MVDISTRTNVDYLPLSWHILDGDEQSALAVLPPGQQPPVRTEYEDGWAPDAVCKLYHSLELHQDFSASQPLAQSIPRTTRAVSSDFNLPKLKRIKKKYLKFCRVEKSFCLLAQGREIPTISCSLSCFGVRYVKQWGWRRTNEGQGEGVKGLSSTFEVSAIETAKVCKSEK